MNLPHNTYNTELYEILEIPSLEWAIKKRKMTFFRQLMENRITSDILLSRGSALDYLFIQLNIADQGEMEVNEYKRRIIRKCDMELMRIKTMEGKMKMSDHAKVIKNLWTHRDEDENEETLMIMCKAKHGMRHIFESRYQMDAG